MEEVPFEDRRVPLAEIDWNRSVWWWYPLTRAIHPAIRMFSLAWSLIAVLLLYVGLNQASWLFGIKDAEGNLINFTLLFDREGWLTLGNQLFSLLANLSINGIAYLTFALLWISLIAGFFGGVLVRRATFELGQRTIGPWLESIRISASRATSYLWTTGMHLEVLVLLLLPYALLGVISRWGNIGATLAGILLLVSIPVLFAVGRAVVSMLLCYPLAVAAINIEKKGDAFEGFSRSNAYIFQRPVLAVICIALLAAIGVVGQQLVSWIVTAGWSLISTTYLATGDRSEATLGYVSAGSWLSKGVIASFSFSYFWSATAGLYLILRRAVDSTELDEMELIESQTQKTLPEIPAVSQSANVAKGDSPLTPPPASASDEVD